MSLLIEVSSDKLEAVNDYKILGHDIITKSLKYIGHEEGKNYKLIYMLLYHNHLSHYKVNHLNKFHLPFFLQYIV